MLSYCFSVFSYARCYICVLTSGEFYNAYQSSRITKISIPLRKRGKGKGYFDTQRRYSLIRWQTGPTNSSILCFRLPRLCKTSARALRGRGGGKNMQSNFYPSSAPIADLPTRVSAPSHSASVFLDSALNKSPLSPREYEVARACLRHAAKIWHPTSSRLIIPAELGA